MKSETEIEDFTVTVYNFTCIMCHDLFGLFPFSPNVVENLFPDLSSCPPVSKNNVGRNPSSLINSSLSVA